MQPIVIKSAAMSRSGRPRPTGEPGADIARKPSHELYSMLPVARRRRVMDFVDWLLRADQDETSIRNIVEDICARLMALGLPIDRYGSSTTVIMPEHDAVGRVWVRDRGVKENTYIRPQGDDPEYLRSPLHLAVETGRWVELWLPDTPDERFGIVPELKNDGYIHYLCMPIRLSNHANGWITMATRSEAGFTPGDLAAIALVVPALAKLIDSRVSWLTLDRLLRTYVGDEPHRAILAGNVKRGQVSTIRSAMLFADMRDSTGHTAELSAVQAVELFNEFFDCLVPPIEKRRGEVLKYLGDGLLAIFREGKVGECDASARALAAAEELQTSVQAYNQSRPALRPVEVGVALHYGEAAYGNVGSGQRLDFTVIGRDVAFASRIGSMNARLGEPLLMSAAFADKLRHDVTPLGAFAARGFAAPIEVFRPSKTDGRAR